MTAIANYLKGKKTYIVAVLIVVVALLKGYLEGDMSLLDQILTILGGAAMASFRAAIGKVLE